MTVDLPPDVVQRLKMRAAEEGLKLKDLIAEACRAFLAQHRKPKKRKADKSPFPIIKGGHPPKRVDELSPERIDEILWGPTK